jgi:Fur family ferric uptake transcriptional regulator
MATSNAERHREDWALHAALALKRAGHRSSGPRAAVVDVLAGQRCVLTAGEIADALRAENRHVGIATVYRALDVLGDLGVVQRLDTGEGPARYERVNPSGDHHHHIVCDRCGKVSAFEDDALERAITRLARRLDHTVEGHDVILRGTCRECAADAGPAAPAVTPPDGRSPVPR